MTYGAGSIGPASIGTLSKDLRELLSPTAATNEYRLDKETYTIREVAEKAKDFLFDRYRAAYPEGVPNYFMGYRVCGYSLRTIWRGSSAVNLDAERDSTEGASLEAIRAHIEIRCGHRGRSSRAAPRVGDHLDILVANAGISKAASIEETRVEHFDNLFAVNVRAPFFLVQQLLPALCKDSKIIFTSSLAARDSVGALSAYGATKGAVDTLVKHFASALGPAASVSMPSPPSTAAPNSEVRAS